jgi:hypothetical protein
MYENSLVSSMFIQKQLGIAYEKKRTSEENEAFQSLIGWR